jgi:homospermidine synthase
MVNKISQWSIEEISNNKNEFFVDKIMDNKQGLIIKLSDNRETKLKIVWTHEELISYRNTNENYYLFGLGQLSERQRLRKNFYIIENSEYVKFIKKWASPEVIQITGGLIHFAIYTTEDCLDVISTTNPTVKVN